MCLSVRHPLWLAPTGSGGTGVAPTPRARLEDADSAACCTCSSRTTGSLTVFDAKTGAQHYGLQRLEAAPNVFASPVGADGRVYITGRDGATVVLRHGPKSEVLATNTLDNGFDSSAALVNGEIYLQGYRYLYCIAEG